VVAVGRRARVEGQEGGTERWTGRRWTVERAMHLLVVRDAWLLGLAGRSAPLFTCHTTQPTHGYAGARRSSAPTQAIGFEASVGRACPWRGRLRKSGLLLMLLLGLVGRRIHSFSNEATRRDEVVVAERRPSSRRRNLELVSLEQRLRRFRCLGRGGCTPGRTTGRHWRSIGGRRARDDAASDAVPPPATLTTKWCQVRC
jgi:hypothetical protein